MKPSKPRRPSVFSQFETDLMPQPTKPRTLKPAIHNAPQSTFDFLATPAADVDTSPSFTLGRAVPNEFPSTILSYRIAIIGDAPGEDEEKLGRPFAGQSGRLLDQVLAKNGIARPACFVGNVCQHRPPRNDLSNFDVQGSEIQGGLAQLRGDLAAFNPNVIILLGKHALWAAKGEWKLGNWRGSFFLSTTLVEGREVKCIASYHPTMCNRQYDFLPLLMMDIRKAFPEGKFPEWNPPVRDLVINQPFDRLIYLMETILINKPSISLDIEGGVKDMSCISIAAGAAHSFIIPFSRLDEGSYWEDPEQELLIWRRLIEILSDPLIPKTWQNGLYDRFVLQHSHNIVVRANHDDTLLKFWEYNCEMDKDLGFQASVLTREPYYKFERKSVTQDTFYQYCCKDSAVTYEINQKLTGLLNSQQCKHYEINNFLLHPLLYMELRGIRYNEPLAKERLIEMKNHVYRAQESLDQIAFEKGAIARLDFSKPNPEILAQVNSICGYKKDPSTPKAAFVELGYWAVHQRLSLPTPLSDSERGQVSILTKTTMNTKSTKFKDFLYKTCDLPTQYKKDPKTKEPRITTDYEALLKLSKSHNSPVLLHALDLSRLRTRAQMLAIIPYRGRMHCSLNLVGSETGRVSSSKSALHTTEGRVGANMQTVPDDWDLEDENNPLVQGMRDLLLADPGCYLAKCDLKGADGWTVGSFMAMLGDPTMLDDLRFGIKPAQVVAYILKHGAGPTLGKNRHEIKELCKEIKKDDWEYFVSKQGIWGTCYTMGPRKLAERVFIESEGKVNMSEKDAKEFQACIQVRYRVSLWHRWMQRSLESQTYPASLTASNGFTRKFYGRKTEILGDALAHRPQVYTTYATNKAAYNLWSAPDTRLSSSKTACRLRVEPMHQVHDELLVQFKIEDTAWAIGKIKQWFNNPIQIANQTLVIPFDGAYGTKWSMDESAKVGEIK